MPSLAKRGISAALTAAIVAASPGLSSYEAMAAHQRRGGPVGPARPSHERVETELPAVPAELETREADGIEERPLITLSEESAELLAHPESVSLTPEQLAALPAGSLAPAGQAMMDPIVRTHSMAAEGDAVVAEPPVRAGRSRVLPDKQGNSQFWKLLGLESAAEVGANFHYTALPEIAGSSANLSIARAVNYTSQAVAGSTTGPGVNKSDIGSTLKRTMLARSFAVASIAVLYFGGQLSTNAFFFSYLAILAAVGFVQSVNMTAGSVAMTRIVGVDDAHYNRANAVTSIVHGAVGTLAPLFAGWFINHVGAALGGALAGSIHAYTVYALIALAVAYGYRFVKVPPDDLYDAHRALATYVSGPGETIADAQSSYEEEEEEERPPTLREELLDGWRLIRGHRFLFLTMLMSALDLLLGEVFLFPFMHEYLKGLNAGGTFSFYLSSASLASTLGAVVMIFWRDRSRADLESRLARWGERLAESEDLDQRRFANAKAAISKAVKDVLTGYRADLGRARTAASLQEDVSGLALRYLNESVFEGKRSGDDMSALAKDTGLETELAGWSEARFESVMREAREEAESGLDYLQRQWRVAMWFLAAHWLAHIVIFSTSDLAFSLGAMFVSSALAAPALIAGMSLTQRILQEGFPKSMGKIYAVEIVFVSAGIILGLLGYGLLMYFLSPSFEVLRQSGIWIMIAAAALHVVLSFKAFPNTFARLVRKFARLARKLVK